MALPAANMWIEAFPAGANAVGFYPHLALEKRKRTFEARL